MDRWHRLLGHRDGTASHGSGPQCRAPRPVEPRPMRWQLARCSFAAPFRRPSSAGDPHHMLNVRQLTKRYGERVALDGLSIHIPERQFVALLGPNGAGKSTLFQVLTGLFAADGGDVEVAGYALRTDAVSALAHIGVVFQQMSLDLDLSVQRN